METSSQDSVSTYVRNGLGAGLAVLTPELQRDSQLRVLPLSGFPSLPIGVFWRGKLGEIAQVFVDELKDRAKRLFQAKTSRFVIGRSRVRIPSLASLIIRYLRRHLLSEKALNFRVTALKLPAFSSAKPLSER